MTGIEVGEWSIFEKSLQCENNKVTSPSKKTFGIAHTNRSRDQNKKNSTSKLGLPDQVRYSINIAATPLDSLLSFLSVV